MKPFLPLGLALLGFLTTACPEQPAPVETAPPAPTPAAPAPTAPDSAAIQTEIQAQIDKTNAAIKDKDAATWVSAFTDDATWILSNASTYRGRAEIEQGAKVYFDTFESYMLSSMTIDKLVVISDSEALTFSTNLYTQKVADKEPEARRTPFVDYWQKGTDGVWRIAYEVNADGPVAAEAPENP